MLRLFGKTRWTRLVKFVVIGVVVYFIVWQLLYMLLLHSGPSVETIKDKIAVVMGVSPSEFVYVGGYLRRESRVLLRHEGDVSFEGEYEEISRDCQSFDIIMNFLKMMKVNINKEDSIKIIKFSMDFDTVFCVISRNEQWIVFYGNTVM